jgi:hypothetical protein
MKKYAKGAAPSNGAGRSKDAYRFLRGLPLEVDGFREERILLELPEPSDGARRNNRTYQFSPVFPMGGYCLEEERILLELPEP